MNQDAITEEPGWGERQKQNDCMLTLFQCKEHLSETSSGTLLTEVKHHGRRDVNLGPPLPVLYVLCVKQNSSYIPTMDFTFATALLIGTNIKPNASSFFPADVYLRHTYISCHQHPQILIIGFPKLFFFK